MEVKLDTLLAQDFTKFSSLSYAVADFDHYPDLIKNPSCMTTLELEQNFNYNYLRIWMSTNWKLPIYLSVLYVLGIFVGQKWMKERLPYKLERSLNIWNFLLPRSRWRGSCVHFQKLCSCLINLMDFTKFHAVRYIINSITRVYKF